MHLAHEELCHMAMERLGCDGLVIHMLLGKLKPGDIPAPVRDAAIRKMVELYFPPNSAMVTGYGFDMLYAGPREAVLHAYFRQNMGATHFIIGRDHAGVGDYYGAFDAQTIFDEEVPEGALEIEIFKADHTAWSKKLGQGGDDARGPGPHQGGLRAALRDQGARDARQRHRPAARSSPVPRWPRS
jgi:sulfate adenylyltransferase